MPVHSKQILHVLSTFIADFYFNNIYSKAIEIRNKSSELNKNSNYL